MSICKKTDSRSEKSAGRIIRKILLLVFSLGLLIGIYKCLQITHINKTARKAYTQLSISVLNSSDINKSENENAEKVSLREAEDESGDAEKIRRQSMDFTKLKQINPEIAAWLKATGTGIDYPVMYTDNNSFYLTHLYDGSSNANGALFIDCGNTGPLNDTNTVIYGHNMYSGSMFHALNEYKSQDFYDAWPTMTLYTPDGDYLVELVCGTIENGDYPFVKFNFENDDELFEYINNLKARSTFESNVEIQPGDKLLSMCTCTYERNNARYMLVGKLTELYE